MTMTPIERFANAVRELQSVADALSLIRHRCWLMPSPVLVSTD
jgi:hypothetical protein